MQRHKFTLGSVVIAAGLIYLFVAGVRESTATHMTLQTLLGESLDADRRIQLGGGGTASTLKRADLGIALFQVLAAPRDGDVQGFVVHVVVAQTAEIDRIINATGGVVGEVDGRFHRRAPV